MRKRACSILIAALCWSTAAVAQNEPPPAFPAPQICPASENPAAEPDGQTIEQIMNEFGRTGYAGLARRRTELAEMLDRAPACYPEIEQRGDQIIIRREPDATTTLALLMGAAVENRAATIVNEQNTYAIASLLLGAYANETRNYEEALSWLDRGLALQPHNEYLVGEKAAALAALRRPQEAYDLLRATYDDPQQPPTMNRARLQRMMGVNLIDLNRLDEAEAALNESIRIEPNNPIARQELEYIAQLRRGAQQRNIQLVNPEAQTPNK